MHGDSRLVPQESLLSHQQHEQHDHGRHGDRKQEVSEEAEGTMPSDHADNKTQQEIDHHYHCRPPTPRLANNVPSAGDPLVLGAGGRAELSILRPHASAARQFDSRDILEF
jgi:hypothetical protein